MQARHRHMILTVYGKQEGLRTEDLEELRSTQFSVFSPDLFFPELLSKGVYPFGELRSKRGMHRGLGLGSQHHTRFVQKTQPPRCSRYKCRP